MLECIPNFSEGTDVNTVEQIVSSIKSCPILDLHSDPDHNRSVATFAGESDQVLLAAFELAKQAVELIDVNSHQGVHPFIGAVDVIPFVPLGDTPMKEAVSVANELGQKLWKELNLPVYFYGKAAKIAERENLAYVRRGGYGLLKQEISSPHRKPDIGHGLHHSAGAVAVGARDFLIAFNINLNTPDLEIAHSIAKNIREKASGLKGVKAIGLYLKSRNITQVSINLTDCAGTSLREVFHRVSGWAKEYKVKIIESELVGMIPEHAVFHGMAKYLMLKNYSERKILRNSGR